MHAVTLKFTATAGNQGGSNMIRTCILLIKSIKIIDHTASTVLLAVQRAGAGARAGAATLPAQYY